MILTQSKSTVTTSEEFQELEFGIKSSDMGLILDILRSKMYKNPIQSICREVASNSRDANREVGSDKPIRIGISGNNFITSQMAVYFEDDGPGISPDRMADVFVNYGASTKRSSNEQTGGFGLGAKTPFSYTDSFNIITRYEGKEYTYVAAIEDGKKGKLYLLNKKDTEKGNGTTVLIPIDEYDRKEFEDAIIKATYFWEIPPTYENITATESNTETIYNDDDFIVYKNNRIFSENYGILIDGIFYSLDYSSLGKTLDGLPFNHCVAFKFKTGQLTISANREALQYDNRTKYQLNKKIKLFEEKSKCFSQELIDETETYIKKALLVRNLSCLKHPEDYRYVFLVQSLRTQVTDDIEFTHNGNKVSFEPLKDFSHLKFFFYEKTIGAAVSRRQLERYCSYFENVPIFFGDEPRVSTPRNRTIFQSNSNFIFVKVAHDFFYEWKELTFSQKKKHAKTMRAILNQLDLLQNSGMDIKYYSNIEKTKAPHTGDSRPSGQKYEDRKVFPVRAFFPLETYRSPHIYKTLTIEKGVYSIGAKEVDLNHVFYIPCGNLLSFNQQDGDAVLAGILNSLRKIDEEPLCMVIFINENKVKSIKKDIPSAEQFYKNLPISRKKMLIDMSLFSIDSNKETFTSICVDDRSFIDEFNFQSNIGKTAKDLWLKVRHKFKSKRRLINTLFYLNCTSKNLLLEELKDYVDKSTVKEAQKVTNEFFKHFKLLQAALHEFRYATYKREIYEGLQDYINKTEELLKLKGQNI